MGDKEKRQSGDKIDRVDYRAKLKLSRDPYWKRLTQGRYVGFRYMTKGSPGSWLARAYGDAGYAYATLGDFSTLPEGERYDAAKKAAEEWFAQLDAGLSLTAGKGTVRSACEAYVERVRFGLDNQGKRRVNRETAAKDMLARYGRTVFNDPLGRIELGKLKPKHFEDWKKRQLAKGWSESSYNRYATALRAALNSAVKKGEIAHSKSWAHELTPFEGAGERRDVYLNPEQRSALIASASEESKPLFRTLNMLPMRPGEVAALRVEYLKVGQRALEIPTGKTEHRVIPLGESALAHFKACASGKTPAAWLVSRADGSQWKKEAWRDEVKPAARKAKLSRVKDIVAYTFRHSVITDLVTGGTDLFTVAKLAGTSVAMIEKHYGHLQREHARAALEKLAALA